MFLLPHWLVVRRKGLRTHPDVLAVFAKDLQSARSLGGVRSALNELPGRLMSTGAFKSVSVESAPSRSNPGSGLDVHVSLHESSFSLTSGVTQSLNGRLDAGTEVSVINVLGQAETISAKMGSATGEMSLAGLQDMLNPFQSGSFGGETSTSTSSSSSGTAASTLSRAKEAIMSPTYLLELRKPTLGDRRMPSSLRFRHEVEHHDLLSGFRNRVVEAEASVSDPSLRHSLIYTAAWRNILPLKHPHKVFLTASSPEVVADCDASVKSSVAYAYHNNKLNARTGPSAGHRTVFRTELAGLGGDVNFLKTSFQGSYYASLLRYAPDSGYHLPLSASAWKQRVAAESKRLLAEMEAAAAAGSAAGAGAGAGMPVSTVTEEDVEAASEHSDSERGLRPHPGTAVLGHWWDALTGQRMQQRSGASSASSTPSVLPVTPLVSVSHSHSGSEGVAGEGSPEDRARAYLQEHRNKSVWAPSPSSASSVDTDSEYTLSHRIAGWLSPGVTLNVDLSFGALVPFGADAVRRTGSRIVDRFFLFGSRFRGFDSVGPRAAPVEAGTFSGDALGGDYMAAACARILLPPPLPSVRLANAGLRTQLWASAGSLVAAKDVNGLGDFISRGSASAGVGVVSTSTIALCKYNTTAHGHSRSCSPFSRFPVPVQYLPIVNGASLEANYTLWHKANSCDLTAGFRMQLAL